MFTVKAYSTKGKRVTEIETEATTWGELQTALNEAEVETYGMKAIVMENQNTLESSEAILPKGLNINGTVTQGFTLFLTPIKTKSGTDSAVNVDSMGYWDCRKFIKNERDSNESAAKFFGNYTNLNTEKMRKKIKKYLQSSESTPDDGKVINGDFDLKTVELSPKEKLEVGIDLIREAFQELRESGELEPVNSESEEYVLEEAFQKIWANFPEEVQKSAA